MAGTTGFGIAVAVADGAAARSAAGGVVSAAAGAISEEEAPVEIGNRLELTAEERERIRLAVQEAERRTKAEVVPLIVARSGLYREVRHWVGLGLALLVLTILLTIESHWLPWGWHASNAAWLLLSTLVAYGCGVWLGTLWPVIRLCASVERMRHKVKLRAEHAFSQHAVSHTRERTGVLIMLSILERQIYVLPDRSLDGLASRDHWAQVVQLLSIDYSVAISSVGSARESNDAACCLPTSVPVVRVTTRTNYRTN